MKMAWNVAVLGATGAVGEMMLSILAERKFPVDQIYALASSRSVGEVVNFGRESLEVLDAETLIGHKSRLPFSLPVRRFRQNMPLWRQKRGAW